MKAEIIYQPPIPEDPNRAWMARILSLNHNQSRGMLKSSYSYMNTTTTIKSSQKQSVKCKSVPLTRYSQ